MVFSRVKWFDLSDQMDFAWKFLRIAHFLYWRWWCVTSDIHIQYPCLQLRRPHEAEHELGVKWTMTGHCCVDVLPQVTRKFCHFEVRCHWAEHRHPNENSSEMPYAACERIYGLVHTTHIRSHSQFQKLNKLFPLLIHTLIVAHGN